MKVSRIIIALSIIALFSFEIVGQTGFKDGYIIKANGERLEGKTRFLLNAQRYSTVRFKSNGKTFQFSPSDITEYGTNDGFLFTTSVIKGEFVEELIKGSLSLYKSKKGFLAMTQAGEIVNLFGQKSTEKLEASAANQFISKKWKGVLFELMSDCDQINVADIKKLLLNETELVKIVDNYNRCKSGNSIIVKENMPNLKLKVGFSVGTTNTTITSGTILPDSGPPQYLESNSSLSSISGGLMFNLYHNRQIKGLSYSMELWFHQASHNSVINGFAPGNGGVTSPTRILVRTTVDYSITTLSLPFLVKYSLDTWGLGINLFGGVVFSNTNVDFNMSSIEVRNGSDFDIPQPNFTNLHLGSLARLSLSKLIGNNEMGIQVDYQLQTSRLSTSQGGFRDINRATFSIYALF